MSPQPTTNREAESSPEPLIKKSELAAYLGTSKRFVEMRVREGMPCIRIGSAVRFNRTAVLRWAEDQQGGHR